MKRLLILFLLCSCGSPTGPKITLKEGAQIVSQGPLENYPQLFAAYNDVRACLEYNRSFSGNIYGDLRADTPSIVVMDAPGVYETVDRSGWISDNTIYLYAGHHEIMNPLKDWVFAHEAVHVLTGLGNDQHETYAFLSCQDPSGRGIWTQLTMK